MSAELIHVNAGAGYDIHIEKGLLSQAGALTRTVSHAGKAALITDTNVAGLYAGAVRQSLEAAGFETSLFAFPAGEESKNHRTLLDIYAFLSSAGITRGDILVALGGGVVGDVAGFAAASWLRGLPFVQIPTTLLAQVDSSIGGKTAVDLPEGKNLVGAFWQPSLVLCDPLTLDTLSDRLFACGMGEVIKHACIRSNALFDRLEATDDLRAAMPVLVADNLRIKKEVVERDEHDRGERMLLNFGHTLGHAIEKLHHFTGVTHGEAVAMGMALITRCSERAGLTAPGSADRLTALLKKAGLPAECPLPLGDIVAAAGGDKKRVGGDIHLVLLHEIGQGFLHRIPVKDMPSFFNPGEDV